MVRYNIPHRIPGDESMRHMLTLAALLLVAGSLFAQNKPPLPPRFGVAAEPEIFSQDSPKQLLASLDKAFARKRIDYVLAHLLEPSYGDLKLAEYYRKKFGRLPEDDRELTIEQRDARAKEALQLFIAEVNDHMASEPKKTLRFFRLLKEGNVEEAGTTAKVTLKDAPTMALNLRQVEGRWYMDNNLEEAPPKAEAGKTEK
jgi:hypothetical protein